MKNLDPISRSILIAIPGLEARYRAARARSREEQIEALTEEKPQQPLPIRPVS